MKISTISGFTFLREVTYACAGMTNKMQEFRHDATGMEFAYIPGVSFTMGSKDGGDNEKPLHKVYLSPYLIGSYTVTQAQWQNVMGDNPSHFSEAGDNAPVEQVSWDDCQIFCQKTDLQLPSEAQWEYACRAGCMGAYCFGDSESQLGDYAWYDVNSGDRTHPIGQKKPNAFGLYDMHGNVNEWCQDGYQEYLTEDASDTDPTGLCRPRRDYAWWEDEDVEDTDPASLCRSYRGGAWNACAGHCRSSCRDGIVPSYRNDSFGFRCVKNLVAL